MPGPARFRRLPRWPGALRPAEQLVPPEARAGCPTLLEDFDHLDRHLLPVFREMDGEALRQQNRFYLTQLLIIVGSALVTILGAWQAAAGGGQLWVGLAETVLAALLGLGTIVTAARNARRAYFTSRLKAERLRSEYFLFLGRQGPYGDERRRHTVLSARVAAISASGGVGR